jgi:K(+)-stimulated pyrophosphate-energized sodium pump
VLIGTAVVGATTMIFSIIVLLTKGLTANLDKLSILHPPFLLGLMAGGSIVYWFTGASCQAVTTGAYRAVEYIKLHINLEGVTKASVADSKKVVEIRTQHAQEASSTCSHDLRLCIRLAEPFPFIGYLISIALFGLYLATSWPMRGGR